MAINPSIFEKLNVIDTCSIWNMLSSHLFYSTARAAGCYFCCTHFVYYECILKPRRNPSIEDKELKKRFVNEYQLGAFPKHHLDIEDLQDLIIIENRKRLSKGELTSIIFAKKTRQAFLTDDQNARKLGEKIIGKNMVQTTPHLFGWLYFICKLGDNDMSKVIKEHEKYGRPLKPYFEEMYLKALEYRLKSHGYGT
jgi:hypothetical protein